MIRKIYFFFLLILVLACPFFSQQQGEISYQDVSLMPEGRKGERIQSLIDTFNANDPGVIKQFLNLECTERFRNSAPMEEVTRLSFGGISVPKAVDSAPSRRLDLALRNISKGCIKSSHKSKRSVSDCLANELILASKGDMNSFAVSKKDEIERVAGSAR